MPRSFSVEKRWAMVYKREVLGLSYETIQEQLEDYDSKGPSPKTIRRMVKLFRSTGGVEDRQGQRHPGHNNIVYDTKLSQKLVDIVLDSPESPLDAIKTSLDAGFSSDGGGGAPPGPDPPGPDDPFRCNLYTLSSVDPT